MTMLLAGSAGRRLTLQPRPFVTANRSRALQHKPGVGEVARGRFLLSHPEVQGAAVAPHHVDVVIAVKLQE